MTENGSIEPGRISGRDKIAEDRRESDKSKLSRLSRFLDEAYDSQNILEYQTPEAAAAVQLLLDIGRRRHDDKWETALNGRHLDDLSEEEIGRLRLLNQKLMEAEQWVWARGKQMVDDYFKAGGISRVRDEAGRHLADYEIVAKVTAVLRGEHPDWRDNEDNIVARIEWLSGLRGDELIADVFKMNWCEYQFQEGHPLQHEYRCWSYHDLTEHALGNDWEKVLSIGGLWVDVTLTQQLGVYW